MQCLKKFKEPVRTIEDVENQSCEAIRLLTKRHVHNVLHKALFCNAVSVRFIPRFSYYSGKADPSTESELRELACRIVRTEYMAMIGASEQHGG